LECVYKISKQSKKDKKDVVGMPCIQESNGKLVTTPNEKLKVWKEYEEKLLNEENDWNKELKKEIVEGPSEKISSEDVLEAVKLMNSGKSPGPSGITVDLLKVCERESIKRLTKIANDMLNGKKMPESWKKSDLIPVYKGKGNVRSCVNYRSIKLLEHGMKVIERVFGEKIKKSC